MPGKSNALGRAENESQEKRFGGKFYTVPEMEVMGLGCRQTIYRMIRDGKLRAIKIGRHNRIDGDSIDEFIASNRFGLEVQ